ncbi:hypothetical protein AAVH_30896, partial [Aphelenchoides avenae]
KHLACPFTNPLSIHLDVVGNIDHQELAEVAAFTDPSFNPLTDAFKITLVSGGMKLRITGFKLLGAPFDPSVAIERALEADFDFVFRQRAFRGGHRPRWMPR